MSRSKTKTRFRPVLETLEERLVFNTYPLTSIPVLNSLPGASASIYLDFNGDYQTQWGSYSNITTPVFDLDGDTTTFNDAELAAINQIWQVVAEDYAPFNLNVTTVEPASFANGVSLRVAIGGKGEWCGGFRGGIAYINSFTNASPNAVFVFPANLSANAMWIGADASHESGHAFGLDHPSTSSTGTDAAPIMAGITSLPRCLWNLGTNVNGVSQDDMATIARSTNGFAYRADDVGNTAGIATPLNLSGNQLTGSGLIGNTSDLDYFSFSTAAGQITLSVNVPSPYNNLDARLELRDATGNTLLATADPSTSYGANITATVPAGSYRLVVASHGNYGDVGQYTINGTIVPDGLAAPSNLTAVPVAFTTVNLSWTDNATSDTGNIVQRSFDGISWNQLASLPANSTNFADSTVSPGLSYLYQVCAVNGSSSSNPSNQAGATLAPASPGGLTASSTSSSQINLAWSDVTGETGYKIQRSTDGVNFVQIASTGTNLTSFSNTGLIASSTYFYRVLAANPGGDSGSSNQASATTQAALTIPPTPTGLTASTVSSSQINLAWSDVSGETGYKIERSTDGVNFIQIATTGTGVVNYQNNGLSAGTTYYFRVRATNTTGDSAYGSLANAITIPAAPANLTAVTVSASQINLAWNDVAGETGYRVERSLDGISFTQIASLAAGTLSFQDLGLAAGTVFYYRVLAYNSGGNSAYSSLANAATSATIAPPAVPSNLTALVVSKSQVNLTWTDNSNNETGFVIQRAVSGKWATLAQVGTNVTSFSDTTVTNRKTYQYRVFAINQGGNSACSNVVQTIG